MATPSHAPLTPNSCLIAVLLVTRSSTGPSLVYHYPPRPRLEPPSLHFNSRGNSDSYNSSSSSSSGSSDSEDDPTDDRALTAADNTSDNESRGAGYAASSRRSRKKERDRDHRERDSSDERRDGNTHPWERVLGFRTDVLAGIVAPRGQQCKGKFEMSVDDMVFLGQLVTVRPDGTWRKRKNRVRGKERRRGRKRQDDGGEDGDDGDRENTDEAPQAKMDDGHSDEEGQTAAKGPDLEGDVDHHDADDEEDGDSSFSGGKQGSDTMTMFHVVFVLNPPELEYHYRVREVYECVAKNLSRALKYQQAKDRYVSREAETIMRLKEQAIQKDVRFSDLWRQIREQSSLAYAIQQIFLDISQSRIAHVLLNNFPLSLQIPIINEISVLPSITEPQVPGLPLTTANSFGDDETKGDTLLAKHFTLLYLEDETTILASLSLETPTDATSSLTHFVKSCNPMQSFLTISQQSGIHLHEIQLLARHLVQWRKARAIPPIQARDIYIVSPNADVKGLPPLIEKYRKEFPSFPSLPKILGMLSGKPKPYAAIIPTKDHRSAYLNILAWMLRHGLVTQLRSFAWIRVPRSIKIAVHRERLMKKAAATAASAAQNSGTNSPNAHASTSASPPGSPSALPDHMLTSTSSLLSNSLASLTGTEDNDDTETSSSSNSDIFKDSIILEPDRASGLESAWLEMMTRNHPSDVKALFERFLKYLNGRHALEKIPVREGVQRREVRKVFRAFEEEIIYARHW